MFISVFTLCSRRSKSFLLTDESTEHDTLLHRSKLDVHTILSHDLLNRLSLGTDDSFVEILAQEEASFGRHFGGDHVEGAENGVVIAPNFDGEGEFACLTSILGQPCRNHFCKSKSDNSLILS